MSGCKIYAIRYYNHERYAIGIGVRGIFIDGELGSASPFIRDRNLLKSDKTFKYRTSQVSHDKKFIISIPILNLIITHQKESSVVLVVNLHKESIVSWHWDRFYESYKKWEDRNMVSKEVNIINKKI